MSDALSTVNPVKSIWPYIWSAQQPAMKRRVVLAVLCLIAAKLVAVYIPILYKKVVDAITTLGLDQAQAAALIPVAVIVGYGLMRILGQLFSELQDAIFIRVSQNAIRQSALDVFRHLHRLSLRFHLDRQTGGLSRAIQRGTTSIDNLATYILFSVMPTLFEILLVCGILWALYDYKYALITLGTLSLYVGYTVWVTEWRVRYRREANEKDEEANTKAIDSLLNYETVKYFGNEEREAERYNKALVEFARAEVKSQLTLSMLNMGQGVIIAAGVIWIMLLSANAVASRAMTVGDFVLVNTYLLQLYVPLNMLGWVYREVKEALTNMEAMFTLGREAPEVQDKADANELAVKEGRIEFKNVAFGYDVRRPILEDISFTIQPGEKLAIVGASGSGKSTIARLLFRFYDAQRGEILIDGQNVRDLQQKSLRAKIGVVPQDTVLFNDTIAYNIAYGNLDASEAEVERAARAAQLHDFIMSLPDKYQTKVGERGLKLSGGEKQRVAIARTILKNPPILIFDEATSALDSFTEREIQASLNQIAKNHSTLVIAHRLSTIVDADEIIVLEDGHIAERGRHAQLLQKGGIYAALWAKQLENKGADAAGDRRAVS